MTCCHCRGMLSVLSDEYGRTMTRCTSCGALACVRRIPAEQLELSPPPVLADGAERCATSACWSASVGRSPFCQACRDRRVADRKRHHYEVKVRPVLEREWTGPRKSEEHKARISGGMRRAHARRRSAA